MESMKRTVAYRLHSPDISSLLGLVVLADERVRAEFRVSYGRLLSLLYRPSAFETTGVYTLMQFYEPQLRGFLFPDYILAPTLEEYSAMLGVPVLDQMPFIHVDVEPELATLAEIVSLDVSEFPGGLVKLNGAYGFHLSVLVEKATQCAKSGCWVAFSAILAVCIYGIVLFPNVPDFVDSDAFLILASKNPVPTLLGDVYHSIHYKNEKRRGKNVSCCLSLLYMWFQGHLPKTGPFVDVVDTLDWSSRLMGLSAENIIWFDRSMFGTDIIYSCSGFPNVPLIGRKGCINYNPSLLVRHFGYVLRDAPIEVEIQESLYLTGLLGEAVLIRLRHGWANIHRRGKALLGKSNNKAYDPYLAWIHERARISLMPYPAVEPLYMPVVEVPTSVEIEKYNKLLVENEELKRANDELEKEIFQLRHEKNEATFTVKEQIELINRLGSELTEETNKREKVGVALNGVSKVLASKKELLNKAYSRLGKWETLWNTTLTKQKEREDELKLQIATLEAQIRAQDAKIAEETSLRSAVELRVSDLGKELRGCESKAGSKRCRLDECFGEGTCKDDAKRLRSTAERHALLIQELISRLGHSETLSILENVRARHLA